MLCPVTSIRTAGHPRFVSIGLKIRKARTDAGYSQERFAEKIGSSRRHVMRLERGDHQPGAAMVKRMAEVTGKPESFFADDDDEEADHAMARDLMAVLTGIESRLESRLVARLRSREETRA